jgi:Fe-S cluster assembly ATP-binding protein
VFLAFQYPVEIPGVSNMYFLRAALNAIRKHQGQEELDAVEFIAYVKEKMKQLKMDEAMLKRAVLDIDALKLVAEGVNSLRSPERAMIVVTHYQRLLDYIVPDRVHVLAHGKIVKSGDKKLALELEEKGYGWIEELAAKGELATV